MASETCKLQIDRKLHIKIKWDPLNMTDTDTTHTDLPLILHLSIYIGE